MQVVIVRGRKEGHADATLLFGTSGIAPEEQEPPVTWTGTGLRNAACILLCNDLFGVLVNIAATNMDFVIEF